MKRMSYRALKNYILNLNECMDDYLYIYDLKKDRYFISPQALERFNLPDNEFYHVMENHRQVVYENDFELLMEDINQITTKQKSFHNLQYRWLDKKGEPIWINCRGKGLLDEEGNVRYLVGCINEIGKKQIADNASGLIGEAGWKIDFSNHIDTLNKGFILRLGIDDFKGINEKLGMEYGDQTLKETANCIQNVLNKYQSLYRIVADEFIVFDEEGTKETAVYLYKQIAKEIAKMIENKKYETFFTISAGILDLNDYQVTDYTLMMQWSEFALNQAKQNGKNTYFIFSIESYQQFLKRTELLKIFHLSVNHQFKGFELYYQPIMDMKKNQIHSLEALLRFHCDEFGSISPMEFIPILEQSNLIIPVGKWIIDQATKTLKELRQSIPDLIIQINLSYVQVLKTRVLKDIVNKMKEYDLPKNSLVIELTESGFIESNHSFITFCEQLKENGVLLALDDFGTGYSNFHYLYNLKPNKIKIDRSLTMSALTNDYENMLLKHMIDMAHCVNVKICIEGIETQEDLDKILVMQPDYIQGYYYGKPCSLENLKKQFILN